MTVDAAEDVEELMVAWLATLGRTAIERRANDPLPFRMVRRVAGGENVDEFADYPVVSVHTFAARTDPVAARDEAKATHDRMLLLGLDPSQNIELSDGRLANVDYLEVVEAPIWVYFADNVLRKVGRYQIGLSYVTAAS